MTIIASQLHDILGEGLQTGEEIVYPNGLEAAYLYIAYIDDTDDILVLPGHVLAERSMALATQVNWGVGPGGVTGAPMDGLPAGAELRLWALDLNGEDEPVSIPFDLLALIEVDAELNSSFSQQAALSTSITLGGSYGATFSQTSNVTTAITAASSLPYIVSTIAELTTSIVFENVVSVNYTLDAELLTQLLLDSVSSSSFDQISELTTSIEFASALVVNYTQIAELDLVPPIELEATIQIEATSLADLNTNITIFTSVDVEATQEATLNTLITLASNVIFSAELEAVIGEAQPVSEIFAELEFGVMFSVNPEYIENLDISSISNDRSVASVNTLASSGKLYLVVTRADDPAPTAEQINYIIRWH